MWSGVPVSLEREELGKYFSFHQGLSQTKQAHVPDSAQNKCLVAQEWMNWVLG